LPVQTDVTGRILQQFSWWRKGRAAHHRLRGLFYALDGRRVPLWVPTIYRDFEPINPIEAGVPIIEVKRCGFTDLGGPGPQREYILIQARSGIRYYRKIINSVILGDGTRERLFLDTGLDVSLTPSQITRVSFLVLCRLNQDAIEFRHHTATRGMTTTEAVFRSAAAKEGIETLYEVPPEVFPIAECVAEFQWFAFTTGADYTWTERRPDRLDQWGNFYSNVPIGLAGLSTEIYNPNGVLINNLTVYDIGNAINDWYGDTVFFLEGKEYWLESRAYPIRQGKYLLVFASTIGAGYGFDYWWALFEPQPDGSQVCRGAYLYIKFSGPPWYYGERPFELWDDDSAILVHAFAGPISTDSVIIMLPSINEYLAKTWLDWPVYPQPLRIPPTILYPIGNTVDLSANFYDHGPGNHNAGFRLQGNGRDVLYFYVPRDYMAAALRGDSYISTEIRNVIAPLYPNGAMLKIPLGDLDFETNANLVVNVAYYGRATDPYTIDNINWQDADAGAAIPFLDEFTYLTDDSDGGTDCYSPQVETQQRGNGHFWVTFLMVGRDDARDRVAGSAYADVYARVRVFDYNPATEIGIEYFRHTCLLHTSDNVPRENTSEEFDAYAADRFVTTTIVEADGYGTVVCYGQVYKSTLCRFRLPEE
jgi:hypothetical protein